VTTGRRLGFHALVAVATVAAIGPALGCGLMLQDVGELLFLADAIRGGLTPGADYAVTAYGPGRYLLVAGLFEAFGPSLRQVDLLFLAVRLLMSALAWELGRRYLTDWTALIPVACLLIAPAPLHKGFYMAGTLALALALVVYLERPSLRRAAIVGAVLAAVALFRLDLGAVGAVLTLLACLARKERWSHVAPALGPLLVGLAATVGWLALAGEGAAAAVFDQLSHQVRVTQGSTWPGLPGPAALLRSPDGWFLLLPALVYPLVAVRAGWLQGVDRRKAALLAVLGVATLLQVRSKPEWGHLLQAGPLLWLSCSLLVKPLVERGGRAAIAAMALSLLPPAALTAQALTTHRGALYTGAFTTCCDRNQPLDTPLGTVDLNPGEHADLAPLLAHLERDVPSGPLWAPTFQPLLYALADRPDVTGHVGVLFYGGSTEREARVIARLEADPPVVVVFRDDAIEGPHTTLEAFAPSVNAWMRQRYRLDRRIGSWEVLVAR
jgi:hypothetical protein